MHRLGIAKSPDMQIRKLSLDMRDSNDKFKKIGLNSETKMQQVLQRSLCREIYQIQNRNHTKLLEKMK